MLTQDLFSLLENTADAAFTVDGEGIIRSWNRAAEGLFGIAGSEAVGTHCAQTVRGRDSLNAPICAEPCAVIQCAIKHDRVPNYDMEVAHASGKSLWVNVSILVFHEGRNGRRLMIHLARDVSDRKKRELVSHKFFEMVKELSALNASAPPLAPVSPLTEQECRILRLLAAGKQPAQIARELQITPRTLRNHLYHANQKLHTRNRLEAVIQAQQRGLL